MNKSERVKELREMYLKDKDALLKSLEVTKVALLKMRVK